VLYKVETGDNGTHTQRVAANDLINHGFLVFQIEHRLAPPGLAFGQTAHSGHPESGRPPQQGDDVMQHILAALADPECNGIIFLIGGSSGATHALWAALAQDTLVPGWNATARSKIKGIVGLSGTYDLGSRDFGDPGPNFDEGQFVGVIENYTNTKNNDDWYAIEEMWSPINLVASATYIPPTRLYASNNETVPSKQSEDMFDALTNHGGVYVVQHTMNSEAHCFNQWLIENNNTMDCVRDEVIGFLLDQLL
jgi:acetyl esterase/lipase